MDNEKGKEIQPKEFDCIDCGIHVYAFGCFGWEPHHRCAQCQWLSEIVDEAERLKLRTFLRLNDA